MALQSVEVSFPLNNVGVLRNVGKVVLRQRDFEHDMLIVNVSGYQGRSLDLRSGDPAKATLTWRGRTTTFVGYVHHVVPSVLGAGTKMAHEIVLIGASYPLKEGRQRIWRDVTASDIARKIAGQYRLTSDVEAHPVRVSMVNQAGLSDWKFLVEQAQKIGWVLYVSGTVLHFHSRTRNDAARHAAAPRLGFALGNDFLGSTLLSFSPMLGESMPMDGAAKSRRSVRGVDPRSANIVSAHHDGAVRGAKRREHPVGRFATHATDEVANSGAGAVTSASGLAEANRFAYRAKAKAFGVIGVQQNSLLFFENVPGDFDGYWTVVGVDHTFTNETYLMTMDLGTESIGLRNGTVPNQVPVVIDASGVSTVPAAQESVLSAPAGDIRTLIAAAQGNADAAVSVLSLGGYGGVGVVPTEVSSGVALAGGGAVSSLGASPQVSSIVAQIPFDGPVGTPMADDLSLSPQVFEWHGSISSLDSAQTQVASPNFSRGPYVRRHNGY